MEVLVPISDPKLPVMFKFEGIKFAPHPDRLVFSFERFDPTAMLTAQKLAAKILALLPHTPFEAAGWNFGFITTNPSKPLLSVLRTSDQDRISDLNGIIKNSVIQRSILGLLPGHCSQVEVNLAVGQNPDASTFVNVNYNRFAKSAAEARSFLEGFEPDYLYGSSVTLLKDLYEEIAELPESPKSEIDPSEESPPKRLVNQVSPKVLTP
jgi:hypothetical protein